jgi:type IV secretory pathway VirB2 component (pilin)
MGAVGLLNLGAALVRCYPPPDAAAQAAPVFTPGSAPTDAQLQQIVTNNLGSLANTLGTLVAVVMWGLGIWWLTVRWLWLARCWDVCSICRVGGSGPTSTGMTHREQP